MPDHMTPLATLAPTAARRVVSVGVSFALSVTLLFAGLAQAGTSVGGRFVLVILGLGALATAALSQRAGRSGLELRNDGLFDSNGRMLVALGDIAAVDRGVFSFKPSNGFTLRLNCRKPVGWVPGLYWRYGRRLGVGGVTNAAETRAMADRIALLLIERGES